MVCLIARQPRQPLPITMAAAQPTTVPPFPLAFPVPDVAAARDFYIKSVPGLGGWPLLVGWEAPGGTAPASAAANAATTAVLCPPLHAAGWPS